MRAPLRPLGGVRAPAASILLALTLLLCSGQLIGTALAVKARTTLPAVESQVMCATCKIPLPVAQSPQADRERAFIRSLIAKGRTEAQIERALVFQYGRAVLASPSSIFAYLVPILVVLALLAILALLVPRWRRRGRAQENKDPAPVIDSADALRLQDDMARHPS
jgi:cytochrome c-type biogenesis protein CcmH/NrfF